MSASSMRLRTRQYTRNGSSGRRGGSPSFHQLEAQSNEPSTFSSHAHTAQAAASLAQTFHYLISSLTINLLSKICVRALFGAWRTRQGLAAEPATVWLCHALTQVFTKSAVCWAAVFISGLRLPVSGDGVIDVFTLVPLIDWPIFIATHALLDSWTSALVWGPSWAREGTLAAYTANDFSFACSVRHVSFNWLSRGGGRSGKLGLNDVLKFLEFAMIVMLTLFGLRARLHSRPVAGSQTPKNSWTRWLFTFSALHVVELYLWDYRQSLLLRQH